MKHVVMFSGGVSSWGAARRVVERYGPADVTLLFADTLMEDEDLYRFLREASVDVGVPLTTIADGRTPWEVFKDERYLGNTRADPCSRVLKREFLDAWVAKHCDPADTIIYVGIDWTEEHRFVRLRERRQPWRVEAPLCEAPYVTKQGLLAALAARGIAPPRLYGMGFPHNNCGGFCVKAGIGQFALLHKTMPARYLEHERKEEEMRAMLGRDVAILRDRTGGITKPLTMRQLRERLEARSVDREQMLDFGGCGCGVDAEEARA